MSQSSPSAGSLARSRNARIGLLLFALYLVIYGTYVGLAAFRPDLMETRVMGLHLSVAYGFGLIAAAMLLAVIYLFLCRPEPVATEDRA